MLSKASNLLCVKTGMSGSRQVKYSIPALGSGNKRPMAWFRSNRQGKWVHWTYILPETIKSRNVPEATIREVEALMTDDPSVNDGATGDGGDDAGENEETDTSIDFDIEVVECANAEHQSPDESESSDSDELEIVKLKLCICYRLLLITFFIMV